MQTIGVRTLSNKLTQMRPAYWAILIMIAWGAGLLLTQTLRLDAFGIDESGARALLLNWTVSDRTITTALIFGIPDLRSLLFLPLGAYWPGSMIAAKVFTMLIAFAAVYGCYRWSKRQFGAESAMIGAGLFLISPGLIGQIDQIGTGPFLLLALIGCAWLDHRYRQAQRPLGGWFFLQLLLMAFAVSLHPMGLALPIALLWHWHVDPVDERQQKHIYVGVIIAVFVEILLRMGWGDMIWLANPLPALEDALTGHLLAHSSISLILAGVMVLFVCFTLFANRRLAGHDIPFTALMLACLIGSLSGNTAWSSVMLATFLFTGMDQLIKLNEAFPGQGLMAKRGLILGCAFFASLLFLQSIKEHQIRNIGDQLDHIDQLTISLLDEIKDRPVDETVVMSQWPGRTMLIMKRPVLPLPPVFSDGDTLLKNIKGISHLMFNPFDPNNRQLRNNLSEVSSRTRTLTLQKDGVIIEIISATNASADGSGEKE